MTSVGVEEEYLLLDPLTGRPAARAEQVLAAARIRSALDPEEVQHELLQAQAEVATPVCGTLEEVGGHLLRMRHALGEAAEAAGCRLAASGAAPLPGHGPVPVTPAPRYRAMHADAPILTDEQLVNGMHVHVGIPDRGLRVAVLNRLRPWLPVLVALAANSPVWNGADTGFASWRTVVFGRWPITGIPPLFADPDDYDRRTLALRESGMVRDLGQLYWQARLSSRYPTVEIRATDVQLRTDDAVMLAGLVRALTTTALRDEAAGRPLPDRQPESLAGAGWHAARHGLGDELHDPFTGRLRRVGDVVARLVEHTAEALEEAGDTRQVSAGLHRLLREGNGAQRQRRTFATSGLSGLVDLITDHVGSR
ncbi:putative glutamate--cysteine ligase 2 [Kitasatospora indigofera]|uniref:Putative glutamate--cysteine ligase 2 n=1 Tax=Kitasatospora indigofera TaxID=67307 RepID=A0A919G5I6_9ACTN|nr:glutamate--cysteine ligase [Kitasatospora indigofera]GHH77685.1 putative glutamate--cysteine ligase 2 [Kitasatospora indigofera]